MDKKSMKVRSMMYFFILSKRNKPEGYGKYYRSDGCLLMGKFTGGIIANN